MAARIPDSSVSSSDMTPSRSAARVQCCRRGLLKGISDFYQTFGGFPVAARRSRAWTRVGDDGHHAPSQALSARLNRPQAGPWEDQLRNGLEKTGEKRARDARCQCQTADGARTADSPPTGPRAPREVVAGKIDTRGVLARRIMARVSSCQVHAGPAPRSRCISTGGTGFGRCREATQGRPRPHTRLHTPACVRTTPAPVTS